MCSASPPPPSKRHFSFTSYIPHTLGPLFAASRCSGGDFIASDSPKVSLRARKWAFVSEPHKGRRHA